MTKRLRREPARTRKKLRSRQVATQRFDNAVPIAESRLPVEPRGRIPWTVLPLAHPAEIRGKRQQQEQRLAHGAGQMRDRGVDRDHRIERSYDGSGVGKILEPLFELKHVRMRVQERRVLFSHLVLKTDKSRLAHVEERQKLRKWHG